MRAWIAFLSESGVSCARMSITSREIESQPACWSRAAEAARDAAHLAVLPGPGQRVAVVGCGTSWFIAQAYSALREGAGLGETDAFAASEFRWGRAYDLVVAISRSGTTTEVLRVLERLGGATATTAITAITAVPASPITSLAGNSIVLDFADEASVVQTRFATSALAFLRVTLGQDLTSVIADAETALAAPLPSDVTAFDHFVFLGHGWTEGLANEAALKMREAAQAHTEAYPAMEYRHGPISLAGPTSLVWILGTPDPDIARAIRATGASVLMTERDPMAELILIQRTAVALAEARGLDPDRPRNLTRSVVLS
jgi:fructoselysine-6-P-deglycase FrlB-like protein